MSDIKARYVGPSQTGVDVGVRFDDGDMRHVHVAQGGELPAEIDGTKVPASFRDSLLEQADVWTRVTREDTKSKAAAAEKDGDK